MAINEKQLLFTKCVAILLFLRIIIYSASTGTALKILIFHSWNAPVTVRRRKETDKMKKVFVILCVMLMTVSCVFCGCGKKKDENGSNTETQTAQQSTAAGVAESQYVGTWTAVKAELMGKEADLKEALGDELTLELNADGTASLKSSEEESTGNWSETSEGVKLTGTDMNMTLKNENGQLAIDLFGFHIYFDKQ